MKVFARFKRDVKNEYTVASIFLGTILVCSTNVGMSTNATYKTSIKVPVKNEKNMSLNPNTFLDILETNKNDVKDATANIKCAKIMMHLYSMFLSQNL